MSAKIKDNCQQSWLWSLPLTASRINRPHDTCFCVLVSQISEQSIDNCFETFTHSTSFCFVFWSILVLLKAMANKTEKALRPDYHYDAEDSDDEENRDLLRYRFLTRDRKSLVYSLPHIIALYTTITILWVSVIFLSMRQRNVDPSLGVWCELTQDPWGSFEYYSHRMLLHSTCEWGRGIHREAPFQSGTVQFDRVYGLPNCRWKDGPIVEWSV
jgi:hypothetical protein